jgi:hypothetical protein
MPDSQPHYNARTIEAPDGTRITVAYKPGSPIERMSDAEFLTQVHPDLLRAVRPTEPADTGRQSAAVTDLAVERLKRHRPGTPYTAAEVAPLLDGPEAKRIAGPLVTAMCLLLNKGWRPGRP